MADPAGIRPLGRSC